MEFNVHLASRPAMFQRARARLAEISVDLIFRRSEMTIFPRPPVNPSNAGFILLDIHHAAFPEKET